LPSKLAAIRRADLTAGFDSTPGSQKFASAPELSYFDFSLIHRATFYPATATELGALHLAFRPSVHMVAKVRCQLLCDTPFNDGRAAAG
jgi:hypothetical protein